MTSTLSDVFEIKDRGAVVVLAHEGRVVAGDQLLIDGRNWTVSGVEHRVDPNAGSVAVLLRGATRAELAPFIGFPVELIKPNDA